MNRREWVTQADLMMRAYYFGFSMTGVREVDEVLSAVACAGKGYHHTESWADSNDDGEPSYAELIQEAAERAAAVVNSLRGERARIRRELLARIEQDTAPIVWGDFERGFNCGMQHAATKVIGRILPEEG